MLATIGIVIIVVAIIAIFIISSKNSIKRASNQVEEAYSTMDVYLKQRHDLIPNLVNTVKGYTNYEENVLKQMEDISNQAAHAKGINQVITEETKLDNATNKFLSLVQAYPNLKANENFNNLMNQLQQTEKDIANARKYYNASVRVYNDKITTFPGSLFAKDDKKKPYFQVSSEAERDTVNVDF